MSKTLKELLPVMVLQLHQPTFVEPDLSFSKTSVSDVDAEVARFKKVVEESTKELEKFVIRLRKV